MGPLWRLIATGLLFHLAYLSSIFDIYFRSPVQAGLEPVVGVPPAPPRLARRLVMVVGAFLQRYALY